MSEKSELVKGRVVAINEAGIKLEGEDDWRNFTKKEWREKPWDDAEKGDVVVLGMSKDGNFIRSVAVNNGATQADPRPSGAPQREVYIARESAIKSAIELLHDDKDFRDAAIQGKHQMLQSEAAKIHSLIVQGFEEPEPSYDDEAPFE